MTSSANAEPKGSEPSSSDTPFKWCERCGHHKDDHGTPDRHCVWALCGCQRLSGGPFGFQVKESPEEPREGECQHPNKYNYAASGNKKWTRYYSCPDCNAKWETVETFEEEPERCESCGHIHLPNTHTCGYATDEDECCECKGLRPAAFEEPPMMPEEEEQAPADRIHPADCVHEDGCQYLDPTCENGCKVAADELVREVSETACEECLSGKHGPNAHRGHLPPQPDRRPPYAIAYSVQGHLYEVALPGDATVRAVDGALVIQHPLGPVAGIVQVLPVVNGESA